MTVDNVTIRDTHPAEWLTLSQVLAVSSNICAAKIGLGLGENRLYESLRRFGFGEKTGLVSPGEATGTLRPRGRPWVQVETAAASFGQGISVTQPAARDGHGGDRQRRRADGADPDPQGHHGHRRARARSGAQGAAPRRLCRGGENDRRAAGCGDGRGGHRRRGRDRRLSRGRQDRDRAENRSRHRSLLDRPLRGLVRRLRAGGEAAGRRSRS